MSTHHQAMIADSLHLPAMMSARSSIGSVSGATGGSNSGSYRAENTSPVQQTLQQSNGQLSQFFIPSSLDSSRPSISITTGIDTAAPSNNNSNGISGSTHHVRRRSSNVIQPKIRRRNRLITSCLECRRRKLKCDKQHACSNCIKFARDCVFLAPALDPAAQLRLAEIKEKMGSLERTLEDDVVRGRNDSISSIAAISGGLFGTMPGLSESSDEEDENATEEKELEPTPLAFQDAAYYEDADDGADDDLMDIGIRVGKMRISDRVGGFVRPKLAYELGWVIQRYPDFQQGAGNLTSVLPSISEDSLNEAFKPGNDYIAPSSGFFFAPEQQKTSFLHFLPSKYVADRLLTQYWDAVHYMCRIVHRPTFERQYALFWQSATTGIEPPANVQALVMAAMLSAVISVPEETVLLQFGVPKSQMVENFQKGTESALCKANFLRSTKLPTLQAFVMYLIPLCRKEISRAHSALTGTAIRLAECMGLHRDGSHYELSAVEIHVRRLIWHQLCFLDIRTCEATGPRPHLHADDFDTKFPLNVNDVDLEGPNPPTEDAMTWTDMTFSRLRFEANEMHRALWVERPLLEKKKTTLTAVLAKVQRFIDENERKFIPMLDKSKPLHYMAFLAWKLLTLRMHVMLLHRYGSNGQRLMPDRLRRILLGSGTQQTECAIIIETTPLLQPWAWYNGAFTQYHTTLLLLTELYAAPERYFRDRIWKCLDFVFELESDIDPRQKARLILTEVMQKSLAYHSLRKVRAPKVVEDHIVKTPQYRRVSSAPEDLVREITTPVRSVPPITTAIANMKKESSLSPNISPLTTTAIMPNFHSDNFDNEPVQASNNTHINISNVVPMSGVPEFRNFPPHAADVYYSPSAAAPPPPPPASNSARPSLSQQHMSQHQLQQYQQHQQHIQHQQQQQYQHRASHSSGSVGSVHVSVHNSDAASSMGRATGEPPSTTSPNEAMLDIDWNEWDKLFPPDVVIGDMTMPDFSFPAESTILPISYSNSRMMHASMLPS